MRLAPNERERPCVRSIGLVRACVRVAWRSPPVSLDAWPPSSSRGIVRARTLSSATSRRKPTHRFLDVVQRDCSWTKGQPGSVAARQSKEISAKFKTEPIALNDVVREARRRHRRRSGFTKKWAEDVLSRWRRTRELPARAAATLTGRRPTHGAHQTSTAMPAGIAPVRSGVQELRGRLTGVRTSWA